MNRLLIAELAIVLLVINACSTGSTVPLATELPPTETLAPATVLPATTSTATQAPTATTTATATEAPTATQTDTPIPTSTTAPTPTPTATPVPWPIVQRFFSSTQVGVVESGQSILAGNGLLTVNSDIEITFEATFDDASNQTSKGVSGLSFTNRSQLVNGEYRSIYAFYTHSTWTIGPLPDRLVSFSPPGGGNTQRVVIRISADGKNLTYTFPVGQTRSTSLPTSFYAQGKLVGLWVSAASQSTVHITDLAIAVPPGQETKVALLTSTPVPPRFPAEIDLDGKGSKVLNTGRYGLALDDQAGFIPADKKVKTQGGINVTYPTGEVVFVPDAFIKFNAYNGINEILTGKYGQDYSYSYIRAMFAKYGDLPDGGKKRRFVLEIADAKGIGIQPEGEVFEHFGEYRDEGNTVYIRVGIKGNPYQFSNQQNDRIYFQVLGPMVSFLYGKHDEIIKMGGMYGVPYGVPLDGEDRVHLLYPSKLVIR